jgi:hypothetical protein
MYNCGCLDLRIETKSYRKGGTLMKKRARTFLAACLPIAVLFLAIPAGAQ